MQPACDAIAVPARDTDAVAAAQYLLWRRDHDRQGLRISRASRLCCRAGRRRCGVGRPRARPRRGHQPKSMVRVPHHVRCASPDIRDTGLHRLHPPLRTLHQHGRPLMVTACAREPDAQRPQDTRNPQAGSSAGNTVGGGPTALTVFRQHQLDARYAGRTRLQ